MDHPQCARSPPALMSAAQRKYLSILLAPHPLLHPNKHTSQKEEMKADPQITLIHTCCSCVIIKQLKLCTEANTHSPVVCFCTGTWFCRRSLWSPCWRPGRTQTGRGVCLGPSWSVSVDPRPGNCPAGWARPAPPDFPQTLKQRKVWSITVFKDEHTVSH